MIPAPAIIHSRNGRVVLIEALRPVPVRTVWRNASLQHFNRQAKGRKW